MKSKFERLGEILIAIMTIFFFIWFGGFFVGAGKLDWWAESFIIVEAVFGVIFMIISLIVEIFNKKK
jgi:hypothetical protein